MSGKLDRRDLLRRGLAWGGITAAGGMLATENVMASPRRSRGPITLAAENAVFDVACLGETFRLQMPEGNVEGDMRGATFSVEGHIYPEGTIASASGFDPESAAAIGTWFCRGWFIMEPNRPEPHVITTQDYVFGPISERRLFPPDQLASNGMEGSNEETQPPIRPVIGGTGRYAGANGVTVQHGIGMNTTRIEPFDMNAPNFRFEFNLLIPEPPLTLG